MPTRPPIAPRPAAGREIDAIIAEVQDWDDDMLRHMHRRFATSRLFRLRHDPDAEMTERAKRLHAAAEAELVRRGLEPLDKELRA